LYVPVSDYVSSIDNKKSGDTLYVDVQQITKNRFFQLLPPPAECPSDHSFSFLSSFQFTEERKTKITDMVSLITIEA
jgi:hypothetical protein